MQVARDKLVSLGTPIGKLTHSGKFRLTVGALDVLSRYAKHKVSKEWRAKLRRCCRCISIVLVAVTATPGISRAKDDQHQHLNPEGATSFHLSTEALFCIMHCVQQL